MKERIKIIFGMLLGIGSLFLFSFVINKIFDWDLYDKIPSWITPPLFLVSLFIIVALNFAYWYCIEVFEE